MGANGGQRRPMTKIHGMPTSLTTFIVKPIKTYTFYFRSQDVLHCAWFPHFRAQMNCVPGMTTSFTIKPTITTKDMRLDEFVIEGVKTTIPFHRQLMEHPDYLAGNYTTKFMEDFKMLPRV